MQIPQKTRGAISVFLVMILVPCIVVTSLFVDLGRVHMSKSMANSASDLALDSLLSKYDADLNEWYGMAASCQSIEEFYEISAEFFLRTLSSQDLSDDEIFLLSDYYAKATNDDTIVDLLQVKCLTDTGSMINAVDGANLTNPSIIKTQVVEFMKYRAPIELTTGIIQNLMDNKEGLTEAIEAKENEELVDDKIECYTAEGELLAAAYNTYLAIFDYYHSSYEINSFDNSKLIDYSDRLTEYKNAYYQIHKQVVTNLWNTQGLSVYNRVSLSLNEYTSHYSAEDVYTDKVEEVAVKETDSEEEEEEVEVVNVFYYINDSALRNYLDGLEEAIENFESTIADFESAAEELMANLPGIEPDQANVIQWWVRMNNAVNASSGTNHTNKVKTAARSMLDAYAKVSATGECTIVYNDGIDDGLTSRRSSLLSKVASLQANYLTSGSNHNSTYIKATKLLNEVSSNNISYINRSNLLVTVDGESKSIDNAITYIKSRLTAIKTELQAYVDKLTVAIDGNGGLFSGVPKNERVRSLDKLADLAEEYQTSIVTWTNTAETTYTDMAKDHKDEIEVLNKELCDKVTRESVGKLKTRLTNIKKQLESVINAIDSMEYGSKLLEKIASYDDFKKEANKGVESKNIKLINSELDAYIRDTFNTLFSPNTDRVLTLESTDNPDYDPLIDPKTEQVETPDLFIYLYKRFYGEDEEELRKKQDELEREKGNGNKKADDAKDKGRYHGGGSDIAKDFSGSEQFNLGLGALSGIIDLFSSLVTLDITSIRDDLYVTSYIMNMFSYATYEEEGLYNLVEDKTDLKLPTSGHRPTKYADYLGNSETEGSWLSENLKDSYNKSLTNKMINKGNNTAFCAEVEYILYGGRDKKGNADNVKAVYSNIYGIRYTLNLVSGFANFWIDTDDNTTSIAIDSIAKAIQFATGGIIPVPLTKVILIPILTIFETSKDLDRLEAGFPVEIYKMSYEDWWIKVPDMDDIGSFLSGLDNVPDEPKEMKGLFYSDYLTAFVYLGLKSSAAESMYQRMAEVIQANLRGLTNDTSYSMKNARVYFKLEAQLRVKPLMIALPYFGEYDNDLETKTDWCTYNISTTRGY